MFCQFVLNYQGEKTACARQIGNCAGPCVSKSLRNKTKSRIMDQFQSIASDIGVHQLSVTEVVKQLSWPLYLRVLWKPVT